MEIIRIIPFLIFAILQGYIQASDVLDYNTFCVNNSLKFNSSCSVYYDDESDIKEIVDAISNNKSLIVTHVSFNSGTDKLPALEEEDMVLPLRWLIATTNLGKKFLMMKLHFESLSLFSLSFHVKHSNIQLFESPDGCLSENTITSYETMMRQLFFCGFNSTFEIDYAKDSKNQVFVCNLHQRVKGKVYEENLRYVCCKKVNTNIICEEVEDDYVVYVFKSVYRNIVILLIALCCPVLINLLFNMNLSENTEATIINSSSKQTEFTNVKISDFVSSIQDIYSVKTVANYFHEYTTNMLMSLKFSKYLAECVSLTVFPFLIFTIVGMCILNRENLYYMDYRLYVIMYICFFSPTFYVVFLLIWRFVLGTNHTECMVFLTEYWKETNSSVSTSFFAKFPLFRLIGVIIRHKREGSVLHIIIFDKITAFYLLVHHVSNVLFVFINLFDVLLFTLIGIIVSTEIVAQYLALPAFILFYAKECFGEVFNDYKDFLDAVLKHVFEKSLKFRNKNITVSEKENQLRLKCLQCKDKKTVIYFDIVGKPSIRKDVFFRACEMPCFGCPGSPWKNFHSAFRLFMTWLFVLVIVLSLVYTFEVHKDISEISKFLAVFAGGLLPWILKFIVTRSRNDLNYMFVLSPFEKQFDCLLQVDNRSTGRR